MATGYPAGREPAARQHTAAFGREFFPALPGAGPIRTRRHGRTLVLPTLHLQEADMTQLITHGTAPTTEPASDPRPWRWAGGFALAHVVVLFAGFSQEVVVSHGTSLTKLQDTYGSANLTRVFGGGYVEAMGFIVLVPALVLIARLFGRQTETGRVAAQSFLAFGLVYAAATLAVGFAPGAAALYAAHHDVPIGTVAAINDIRNYGFYLQVAISLAMALSLGVAALAERVHVRWVGWGGVAIGAIGIIATPLAQNATGMLELVWWVGLGVLLLRGAPATRATRRLNA
ncbi:MAG TPA: hypothetical protein VHO29_14070 [Marmoricola sp.]|nr:hypothetical protein [Marmoricola sp.]